MKPVKYHRLAAGELIASAKFYQDRKAQLGTAFLAVVESALPAIQRNPDLGKPGKHGSRSWKIKQFPFRIVYLERPDTIWIVAVAHLNRRPDYWSRRMS